MQTKIGLETTICEEIIDQKGLLIYF